MNFLSLVKIDKTDKELITGDKHAGGQSKQIWEAEFSRDSQKSLKTSKEELCLSFGPFYGNPK